MSWYYFKMSVSIKLGALAAMYVKPRDNETIRWYFAISLHHLQVPYPQMHLRDAWGIISDHEIFISPM